MRRKYTFRCEQCRPCNCDDNSKEINLWTTTENGNDDHSDPTAVGKMKDISCRDVGRYYCYGVGTYMKDDGTTDRVEVSTLKASQRGGRIRRSRNGGRRGKKLDECPIQRSHSSTMTRM